MATVGGMSSFSTEFRLTQVFSWPRLNLAHGRHTLYWHSVFVAGTHGFASLGYLSLAHSGVGCSSMSRSLAIVSRT